MNACRGSDAGNRTRPGCAAFTLLELMIVCSLVALMLSFAVPAYQRYLLRAHRADAITTLLAAAACQEKIYSMELHYDTNRCLTNSDTGKYRFRFEPASTTTSTTFVVIAEPVGAGPADICGILSLDQSGSRGISGAEQFQRQCWNGQ